MNKLPVFEWFAAQGDVLVTVNTSVAGVDIPARLRQQEVVDFILGETPTPKMTADERGVSAAMRFGGALHECHFPWEAIIQMSGQDSVIQFRNPTAATGTEPRPRPAPAAPKKKKPDLRLVK